MPTATIALGSNLGDRAANLAAAIAHLDERGRVTAISPVYETPPWGVTDQPAYYNQVVQVQTELAPHALLQALKETEAELGRDPGGRRYGPRLIDFDIVLYGDLVLTSYSLTIPHPRLIERAFVLVPLADIAPGLVHPRLGVTVRQLLARVDVTGVVRVAGAR